MEVTLGGQRLGSGNRNKVWMRDYERSTHDLSYTWRSTMAAGVLVPFMSELALPGDTFDIDLNVDVLTHPTIGPLFGSFKIQLDVFQVPIRLYQGKLHMNMLGIGLDMSKVALPQIEVTGINPVFDKPLDNQQINPSCILSYLGMRGLGHVETGGVLRQFNAIPYLGYWDIYKNYYANKQEEIGAYISKAEASQAITITTATLKDTNGGDVVIPVTSTPPFTYTFVRANEGTSLLITGTGVTDNIDPDAIKFYVQIIVSQLIVRGTDLFTNWTSDPANGTIIGTNPTSLLLTQEIGFGGIEYDNETANDNTNIVPEIETFPLVNIDTMRQNLLAYVATDTPYIIDNSTLAPYGTTIRNTSTGKPKITYPMQGLALKTYQSDLFNNWIQTEWIDGVDGISAVTAIDTSGGSFTIDELNLSKKIYDMLNRIALSGGSYDDWLDAVYTHERTKSAENPIYLGGLIRNLVFEEVVSNSRSLDEPLGTLAGRGRVGNKDKGGHIVAKVDEPSYLIGIISLTPHLDYSQGNKWDTNLKTMNDLHKPALDQIGFQDLITDQLTWWDTKIDANDIPIFKSAGKQPAWINYMTNVNRVLGNFADQTQQMFMTLNRRYQPDLATGEPVIKDLTTYIDPSKFNHIFADTRLDAQNFWTQIAVNIEARRKMSAKVIPNL